MAQLESKWIDTRSFEQITLETVPTDKYQYVVDMILRDNRIFSSSQTMYDLEIIYKERKISSLLEERKSIQSSIETLKNPQKKVEKKRKLSEEDEEVVKKPTASIIDRIYIFIGEQQEIDKKVETLKREIELLIAIQELTIKKYASLNRLAKHYKDHEDIEFLRKGVHWVCEYGDKMIEREKKYQST